MFWLCYLQKPQRSSQCQKERNLTASRETVSGALEWLKVRKQKTRLRMPRIWELHAGLSTCCRRASGDCADGPSGRKYHQCGSSVFYLLSFFRAETSQIFWKNSKECSGSSLCAIKAHITPMLKLHSFTRIWVIFLPNSRKTE